MKKLFTAIIISFGLAVPVAYADHDGTYHGGEMQNSTPGSASGYINYLRHVDNPGSHIDVRAEKGKNWGNGGEFDTAKGAVTCRIPHGSILQIIARTNIRTDKWIKVKWIDSHNYRDAHGKTCNERDRQGWVWANLTEWYYR